MTAARAGPAPARERAFIRLGHGRPRLFQRAGADSRTPLHCAAAARITPLQFTRSTKNKDEGCKVKEEVKEGSERQVPGVSYFLTAPGTLFRFILHPYLRWHGSCRYRPRP